jgi:hypothetical protein
MEILSSGYLRTWDDCAGGNMAHWVLEELGVRTKVCHAVLTVSSIPCMTYFASGPRCCVFSVFTSPTQVDC